MAKSPPLASQMASQFSSPLRFYSRDAILRHRDTEGVQIKILQGISLGGGIHIAATLSFVIIVVSVSRGMVFSKSMAASHRHRLCQPWDGVFEEYGCESSSSSLLAAGWCFRRVWLRVPNMPTSYRMGHRYDDSFLSRSQGCWPGFWTRSLTRDSGLVSDGNNESLLVTCDSWNIWYEYDSLTRYSSKFSSPCTTSLLPMLVVHWCKKNPDVTQNMHVVQQIFI